MEEYRKYMKTASKVLQGENNWMDFKKIMLQSLPPYMRKKFSTRHPKTKKQALNEFEKNMINIYFEETGIFLTLRKKDDEERLR